MLYSCFYTLPRTVLIALGVVVLAGCCRQALRSNVSSLTLAALAVPFLVPSLLLGYTYSSFSFALIREPFWNQVLYGTVVCLRLVPVGILLFFLIPKTVSDEGLYCMRMVAVDSFRQRLMRWRYMLKGHWNACLLCFIVALLLAFNEFEIASLMNVDHWTVALFDAHAQGLLMVESLKYSAVPLLFEGGVILVALFVLSGYELRQLCSVKERGRGKGWKVFLWMYVISAWAGLVLIPFFCLLSQCIPAVSLLFDGFWMGREFLNSLFFAGGGSVLVYSAGMLLLNLSRRHVFGGIFKAIILCIIFAGLLGALPIALFVLSIFQKTPLNSSPVPLIVALFIITFPLAVLLEFLMMPFMNSSQLFCAEKSLQSAVASKRILHEIWLWKLLPKCLIFFFIFCCAYFDLSASAILAPPGMTTVVPRLYNLMHYGQSENLSVTVLIAVFIPIICLLLMGVVSNIFVRLKTRIC
jgi:ABC-type Fe3+ transport system permease subunit